MLRGPENMRETEIMRVPEIRGGFDMMRPDVMRG
jgi:hypothetical protein